MSLRAQEEIGGKASSGGVPDELPDSTRQFARLIKRDERVAVGDLDQAPLWQQFGQAPPMRRRHHTVLGGPDHQLWTVKAAQALGRGEHVSLVEGMHVFAQIAANSPLGLRWTQPGVDQLSGNGSLCHPPKGERQAAERVPVQGLSQQEVARWQLDAKLCSSSRQTGREVLKGFAGRDHESRDALRIQARGELKMARIVSHQGHFAQLQGLQQLGLQPSDDVCSEIGIRP